MHYETSKLYEGPPCDMCQRTMFIGTCTHRPMKKPEWSPALLELAKKASERQEAENKKMAAMTPEEREKYINEWAQRLADDVAGLND